MKAAWGTQMYQARPHKDLKLEARGATWPQRCHNRHQKNHRRRGRRLRSWSSTVVVSPWQEINFPWTISSWGAVLKFTFKFLHSFLVSILSMQNVLLECQVLFAEYTWEQPVAFCFWYLRLCMLGCSCVLSWKQNPSSCYSVIAAWASESLF